ncbi:hypothetical protein TNIN_385291 [Trichonephila inaurata madagascariensis]|uniref:Uncharacterized protein n=1 Tax=Trichonephila inaurata madagascariensis TaxID=2747483 RepID=A0A8X7CMV1_9ARAC|nr:hypothetical protein TNIN_385291 [Trichonephila inaurata madagascariensis]
MFAWPLGLFIVEGTIVQYNNASVLVDCPTLHAHCFSSGWRSAIQLAVYLRRSIGTWMSLPRSPLVGKLARLKPNRESVGPTRSPLLPIITAVVYMHRFYMVRYFEENYLNKINGLLFHGKTDKLLPALGKY